MTALPLRVDTAPHLEGPKRLVALVFALNGLTFASWVSRVPAARDALALTPSGIGLLLLCLSVGSVAALPLSGPVVARIGTAAAVRGAGTVVCVGLVALGAGLAAASVPAAGAALLLTGLGVSTWDVAMNVEGAEVERRLQRSLMPRFHAGFSVGTVVGAGLGATCAALGVPFPTQLAATGVLALPVLLLATRPLPAPGHRERAPTGPGRAAPGGSGAPCWSACSCWRSPSPRAAPTTGSGSRSSTACTGPRRLGAIAFGVFVTAMTLTRVAGGGLLARWGRPVVLRLTAGTALAGLLLVVLADSLPVALVGAALWGVGASLGFPVGMSAASDDPLRRGGPGLGGEHHRLHRVPGRAAADRPARRPRRRAARARRGRRRPGRRGRRGRADRPAPGRRGRPASVTAVQTRELGRTGRQVGIVGLGCWQLGGDWGQVSEADAHAVLHAAVDAGVTLLDTADVYGDGRSERLVGAVLRERAGEGLTVATKMGRRADPHVAEAYTLEAFRGWVDRSRTRARRGPARPGAAALPAGRRLRRRPGLRRARPPRAGGARRGLRRVGRDGRPGSAGDRRPGVATVQIVLNVFRRKPLERVLPAAAAAGVGVLARVPLASGLLTGRYDADTAFGPDDHRSYNRDGSAFDVGETFSGVPYDVGVAAAREVAAQTPEGATTTQLALRWVVDQPGVTCVIPGARNPGQARGNAATADLAPLSPELLGALEQVYDRCGPRARPRPLVAAVSPAARWGTMQA